MSWNGEVLSLPKLLGKKTKELHERLGDGEDLRSLDDARAYVAEQIAPKLQGLIKEAESQRDERLAPLDADRLSMTSAHREQRRRLDEGLASRQQQEEQQRAERMRSGLAGILDRITGRYKQLREQNEREAWESLQRDREQRQRLMDDQLAERQQLEADRTPQKSERELWLEEQQRDTERERQEWLEAQEQSRKQERQRWLAEQQSHVRYVEPEPQEDRLQILREQQGYSIRPEFDRRADPAFEQGREPSAGSEQSPSPDLGPSFDP